MSAAGAWPLEASSPCHTLQTNECAAKHSGEADQHAIQHMGGMLPAAQAIPLYPYTPSYAAPLCSALIKKAERMLRKQHGTVQYAP